ncbi:Cellulose synthase [Chlorella sorokiniana]|uniref:Cellulose synthase n=1 Tax=Chlorella sorokiniana TaxID=3076 RepID=A0A2P6TGZ6_CHLSO|nr:Cellulose synthase [Chlorella sorokiniana]|eukprot:PRW33536.1 Cellulose synthase [Chlorella sorokiniana]
MGAALDCKDKQGRSPLHFAAANGRLPVVRHLWSRGAEVDAETPEGRTPLHLAALGGHAEVATFLLQKSAWAEAYDAADDTPLHLAAKHGHTAVMEALLRHGAKAGAKNKQGLTAMACALVGGHVAAAKLLQGWGASLADRPHGYSLLHLTAGVGALASVTFLLETGANANEHGNAEGVTPLHSAALGGCVRCAQALLDAGADPALTDAEGRLPAELAAPQDERMRELLKTKGRSKAKPAAAAAAKAGSTPATQSAQEQFRALPKAEQLAKVGRWALLEGEDLAAALQHYPAAAAEEVMARIEHLQAARRLLNIQKAMAALHSDEDFQADIAQARVREAIDSIRADTGKYEHYAADPQVLAVLQKMRRIHGVAQANGQRTVGIEDMLAKPGQAKQDEERQLAIEAGCNAHLAAAAAAAACGAGEDAAAAAKAAFDAAFAAAKEAALQKWQAAKSSDGAEAGSGGGQSAKLAAAEGSAASILRRRGGQSAGAAAGGREAEDEAAAKELEERERRKEAEEDENVPEWMRGEFSWRKVWTEVWRQTQMALLMLALFMLGAWVDGFTALAAAACQGQAGAAVWLLQHGASLDAQKNDSWHDTVLHYAAGSGSLACVEALLAFGADPAAKNKLGATPADVAKKAGHPAVANLLAAVAEGQQAAPSREAVVARLAAAEAAERLGGEAAPGVTAKVSLAGAGSSSRKTAPAVAGKGSTQLARSAAQEEMAAARALTKRAFYGLGTGGTVPRRRLWLFRLLGVAAQLLGIVYISWRALRTLRHGWGLAYSLPIWLAEVAGWLLSNCLILGLWSQASGQQAALCRVHRPERLLHTMIPEPEYPSVDVYVVTYSAGNINSCLLKEGRSRSEYVLVLDSDMIVHPDFLERTLGHFYERRPSADSKGISLSGQPGAGTQWVPKRNLAFLQTPQDFYNVEPDDPLVHLSRFFYGPALQGRDGIGAAPCCGTGVVFRRDVLVSVGGQAYGSITEDYNSSMVILSNGFATMYLNERLSVGLAPEAIQDVLAQRLRWSMGALQVMLRNCPLFVPGLTVAQSLLFFDAAGHNFLAIPTFLFATVPLVYLAAHQSPMDCRNMVEFCAFFSCWYLVNRLMLWHGYSGAAGGVRELWTSMHCHCWMAPNNLLAVWRVLFADNALVRWLFRTEIAFKVTRKDLNAEDSLWTALCAALRVLWPHLLYVLAFLATIAVFAFRAVVEDYSAPDTVAYIGSFGWVLMVLLCLYPPLLTLLPREETAQGWKVAWHPFTQAHGNGSGSRVASGGLEAGGSGLRGMLRGMTPRFSSTGSQEQAEDLLVDELAAEAATDAAATAGSAAGPLGLADPAPQAAAAAASLAEAAATLAGPTGSCLERGETMVVPVAPASLYEHTLLARPNFDHRTAPVTSRMYILVHLAIFGALEPCKRPQLKLGWQRQPMAPRRRAAQPRRDRPGAGSAGIGCLPPELLLAVLANVPLAERHRSLALVCRQWAELVHGPALLASLDIQVGPARPQLRLGLLVEWLARRAAGHVRQLRLRLAAPDGSEGLPLYEDSEDNKQEFAATLAAAVTVLAGSLRELSLSTHNLPLPPLGPWLAPLSGLTSLEMACDRDNGTVVVSTPLHFLSGLRSLRLHAPCGQVAVQRWASLPPAITSLWMRSFCSDVPAQLTSLSGLRDLTIVGAFDTDSFEVLEALHSTLTALNLTVLDDMPDCLSRLTGLRSLTIDDCEGSLWEPDDSVLERALPQMQHLTAVYLFSGGLPDTPAALSSLQHLDTVCWSGWDNKPQPLPGGPWLARLRRLVLSCHFLSDAASLATLSGAQRLERLGIRDTCEFEHFSRGPNMRPEVKSYRDAEVAKIIAWTKKHTSLQLLALIKLSPRMARAAAAAQRSRPALCIPSPALARPAMKSAESPSGAAEPHQEATSLGSLPPDLLVAVFAQVPLEERHSSLALVCRQWAELVHSPALLASLNVSLVRTSRCLRSLALRLQPADLLPPLGPWLAPLSRLTSLEWDSTPLTVGGPLTCLASLQQLRLLSSTPHEQELVLQQGAAALPTMLTSLCLQGLKGGFPKQCVTLQRLQELILLHCSCSADSYGSLASLHGSLTALTLRICKSVPGCLGQMTALRSLGVEDANRPQRDDENIFDPAPGWLTGSDLKRWSRHCPTWST